MNFIELLTNRRSVRKFSDQPVSTEDIEVLKKSLLLSPTGKRKNHWDFIFIQDQTTLLKLSAAKEFGSKFLKDAPLAVAIIGDSELSDTWIEDCSIASIIVQLAAEELYLGSCWIQIDKRFGPDQIAAEKIVKSVLSIPANKKILSIIAIGHPLEKSKPFDFDQLQFEKIHTEKY